MKLAAAAGTRVRAYIGLCKLRISLLASFSALAGAVLGTNHLSGRVLVPWIGVFVLACGAGALNQAQEWRIDARMERTRHRPVPSKVIRPGKARWFAAGLIALGLAILTAADPRAAGLGMLAVVWYNGAYTYLKRTSAFAAVPGALTGAIPPAVGWAGAGGRLDDPRLVMVCLLLFVWQVPHFWILLFDRGREYARAGLPALTDVFSEAQIRRIASLWTLGTSACGLLVSMSRLAQAPAARGVLLGVSLWLGYQAIAFLVVPARAGARLFRTLNIFLAVFLAVLCLSRLPDREGKLPGQGWTSAANSASDVAAR